jgi:hypothetical protein
VLIGFVPILKKHCDCVSPHEPVTYFAVYRAQSPERVRSRKFDEVRSAQATHAEDAKTEQFINTLP